MIRDRLKNRGLVKQYKDFLAWAMDAHDKRKKVIRPLVNAVLVAAGVAKWHRRLFGRPGYDKILLIPRADGLTLAQQEEELKNIIEHAKPFIIEHIAFVTDNHGFDATPGDLFTRLADSDLDEDDLRNLREFYNTRLQKALNARFPDRRLKRDRQDDSQSSQP
ncbi:MAG: hypothetical protein B0D91_00815 [Oceanospirillales bacterium LUC14_002_19_P2]|nr:MAG: hypothetical protein B0D91_00815 [Oceanospirillales bacterium LUC14_002_19_P2]